MERSRVLIRRVWEKSGGVERERKRHFLFVYFLNYSLLGFFLKKNPLRGKLVLDWLHMTYRLILFGS